MVLLVQSLLAGVLAGSVYALIGVGLTLVVGVSRIVNLAHGELVMLGMYGAWILFTRLDWDPLLSIALVAPLLFLWGVVLHKGAFERSLAAPPQNQLLLTIGLGLVMSSGATLAFGSGDRILTTSSYSSSVQLLGVSLAEPLLLAFAVSAAACAALVLFLLGTDTGQALRATAQDRDAAQLMGIDVRRMTALAFGLAAALAGIAGALLASTSRLSPQVGGAFTLDALAIVALGGMGSIAGAMLGGILLGLVETIATVYLGGGLEELGVMVLLLVLLLAKPSGLLGRTRP